MRITAVDGLLIRHYADEAVVFDPLSWDAHLLNPAALAVLELVLDAPQSEQSIAAFLSEALNVEERQHAVSHARRVIGDLRSLGLIRTTDADSHADRRDS